MQTKRGSSSKTSRINLKTLLPLLLFILVICITVRTTWYTTKYFLDGDSSSELVLAHHLNEVGKPLSTDWYYSTELRVLNTQLIYAPLFSFFSDWHMVRFTGALILQTILVLSFAYLYRQAKFSAGAFFLGSSLLLLPVSVAYGRIVLYHTYYVPHISIGFIIIGLFMAVMNHHAHHRSFNTIIHFALFLLLSFVSGLGGVRQGLITHCPLLLFLFYLYYQDSKDKPILHSSKAHIFDITVAFLAAAAFAVGYLVNTFILSSVFSFASYNGLKSSLIQPQNLQQMLYGLLCNFGFRRDVPIFSILGLLSIGAIFSFICIISHEISFLRSMHDNQYSAQKLIYLFPLSALFAILFVFIFISNDWYYPLYLIPITVWFIPMLCALWDQLPDRIANLYWKNVGLLLSVLVLISNGLVNTEYFVSAGEHFPQTYEGLTCQNAELKKQLENPLAFLRENGYTFGFADFWSANTLTELSNGEIKTINIVLDANNNKFIYHKWLMQKSTIETEADKVFLMLLSNQEQYYLQTPLKDYGKLIYPSDGRYIIYSFDDPSVLKEYFSEALNTP